MSEYIIKCDFCDAGKRRTRITQEMLKICEYPRHECSVCGTSNLSIYKNNIKLDLTPKYALRCTSCRAMTYFVDKQKKWVSPEKYTCRCGGALKHEAPVSIWTACGTAKNPMIKLKRFY